MGTRETVCERVPFAEQLPYTGANVRMCAILVDRNTQRSEQGVRNHGVVSECVTWLIDDGGFVAPIGLGFCKVQTTCLCMSNANMVGPRIRSVSN